MEDRSPIELINQSAVKKYCLRRAQILRPGHEFNRVSKDFLHNLDLDVQNLIDKKLKQLPSVGKTIA